MGNYTSIYTGSQIDTAVGRVSSGGDLNLKTYTNLSQIGMTKTSTIQEICQALPMGASLLAKKDTTLSSDTVYPFTQIGTLIIEKVGNLQTDYRCVCWLHKTISTPLANDIVYKGVFSYTPNGATWSLWGSPIVTAQRPTELLLEKTSNASVNASKIFKTQNNVVTINIDCRNAVEATAGVALPILTVPAGYRPDTSNQIACITWQGQTLRLIVGTDGSIVIHNGTAIPADNVFYGTITYVATQ